MPTPSNAPYKKEQREAKMSERRHYAIWTSCYVDPWGGKVQVNGTKRVNHGPRGKAALKQAKRLSHSRRFYLMQKIGIRVEKMLAWLDFGINGTIYRG